MQNDLKQDGFCNTSEERTPGKIEKVKLISTTHKAVVTKIC